MSAPTKLKTVLVVNDMAQSLPSANGERICKTAEAIFYHFGKNQLTHVDSLVCLAGIVATTLEQSPEPMRPKLRAWFNAMIDPLAPKIVRPDGNLAGN